MIIYDADITGSLKVNGSDFNLSSISSSIVTNSSSIASLESVSGSYANSASFASDISTNSSSISSLETVSGSYANSSSFASDISANSASIGSLNAVSSSYLLNTTDTLTGDLTVTGNIIATTLNVQDVTASVIYSSGSNIFGSSSIDTQQFTGSILTSGSIEVNGDKFTVSGATGNTVVGGTLNSGAITSTGNSTFAGNVNLTSGALSITADSSNAVTFTESGNGLLTIATPDDIILDAAGDIVIDAGADDIRFKNNGTEVGVINLASSNFTITSAVSDKDIIFGGNDGGTGITALTLDMSEGGNATFAGNVGIGVTGTPNQQLELMGNNAYTSKTRFSYGVGATNYFADWGYNSNGNKVYLTITDGGTAKDVIVANYDGNVGIGTDNPQVPLQIGTHLTTAPADTGLCVSNRKSIRINDADGSYNFGVYIKQNYSGSSYLILGTTHNAVDTDALFVKSGNVGIGLTPNASYSKLQVKAPASSYGFDLIGRDAGSNSESQITFWNSNQTTQLAAIFNTTDNLGFVTGTTERMRIDSSGRVGIGVTPSYANVPLHTKRLGGGDAFNLFEGDSAWVFGEVEITGVKYCQVAGRYGSHSGINVTTGGDVKIGGYDVENPASINRVLEISAAAPTGLILNDTRDTHPITIANEGAVLNFKYNNYNMMTVSPDGNNNIAIIKAKPSTYGSLAILSLYGTNSATYGGSVVVRSSILSQTDGTAFGANLIFKTNDTSNVEQEGMRITSAGISEFKNNGTTASKQSSVIRLSGGGAANGYTLINDLYTATESQLNIGLGFSGSPVVISQNCKVSATVGNQYLSSNAQGNTRPQAFLLDAGDFVFKNTQTSATRAIDSVVALDERMRIADDGKVSIGERNVYASGLTIEKSGNHLFLRASTATAGKYWNFDVASSNRLYIVNNGGTGVYMSDGDTSFTGTSDESLKENIKPLENVLDKIKDYRCVEYNLKSVPNHKKIGFIAQDWKEDYPQIVDKDDEGLLGIKYTETIPVLLKAIQELKAEIEILKTQINN
ncbi:tail fiber domain-containing protein [bacterium]|nr:tail fiber domain-containing protein [bacterium]